MADSGFAQGCLPSTSRTMLGKYWEHFPHGADIGVRGIGASKEEAFEQAALALTAVIADLCAVAPQEAVEINCEAPDDELLPVDWLHAMTSEMATRRMFFSRASVQITDHRLRATVGGKEESWLITWRAKAF
jgi:tRNA nucleotidyltransferase (CCA-adding enzyme)